MAIHLRFPNEDDIEIYSRGSDLKTISGLMHTMAGQKLSGILQPYVKKHYRVRHGFVIIQCTVVLHDTLIPVKFQVDKDTIGKVAGVRTWNNVPSFLSIKLLQAIFLETYEHLKNERLEKALQYLMLVGEPKCFICKGNISHVPDHNGLHHCHRHRLYLTDVHISNCLSVYAMTLQQYHVVLN